MHIGSTRGILGDMVDLDHRHGETQPRTFFTLGTLAGLLTAAFGNGMQFIAEPDRFGGLPPALFFLAGAVIVALVGERRWLPQLAAVGLAISCGLAAVLTGHSPVHPHSGGTITGNLVLLTGILVTAASGVAATVHRFRTCPRSDRRGAATRLSAAVAGFESRSPAASRWPGKITEKIGGSVGDPLVPFALPLRPQSAASAEPVRGHPVPRLGSPLGRNRTRLKNRSKRIRHRMDATRFSAA